MEQINVRKLAKESFDKNLEHRLSIKGSWNVWKLAYDMAFEDFKKIQKEEESKISYWESELNISKDHHETNELKTSKIESVYGC